MSAVLIVDDQEDLRFTLSKIVEKQGYSATTAANGMDALDMLRSSVIDLIFLDIGLPDGSGIDLIHAIKEIADDVDIVMLTGINEAKTAVKALRAGAVDYIVKPFDIIEFKAILKRILQARLMGKRAILEHQDLGGCPRMHFPPTLRYFLKNNARNIVYMTALIFQEKPRFEKKYLFSDKLLGINSIIGNSPPMIKVKKTITMGSAVDSAALITGETGTGKELKKNFQGFTPEACTKMLNHDWQGNIRELRKMTS